MFFTLILFWTAFGFAAGTPVRSNGNCRPELAGFLKLNDGIVEIIGPGQLQIRPDPGYGFDVVGTNCTGGKLKWCTDSQPTSDCNNFTATVLPDDLDAKINNLRVNADGKLRINKFHVKNVQNFTLNADKTIFLRVEAIFEGCPVFLAGSELMMPESTPFLEKARVVVIIVVVLAVFIVLVTVISLCLKNWFEKESQKNWKKVSELPKMPPNQRPLPNKKLIQKFRLKKTFKKLTMTTKTDI